MIIPDAATGVGQNVTFVGDRNRKIRIEVYFRITDSTLTLELQRHQQ